MPTTTYLSQYGISNIGPLTTVFTAPAACATQAHPIYLSYKFEDDSSSNTDRITPYYVNSCDDFPLGDCWASGSKIGEAYSSSNSQDGYTDLGTIAYFSPASQCPGGHTTVGIAAKNDAGDVSSSGIFVPPVVTESPDEYWLPYNPYLNVLMEALDDGETAVICCPENHTIGMGGGGCFSEVPLSVYGNVSTACAWEGRNSDYFTWVNATFTFNDTVQTREIISFTATSNPPLSPTTTTMQYGVDDAQYVAYQGVGAYYLIHKAAEATTGAGSGAAGPTETAPSSAQAWRMTTSGGGVGVLATAWALAALAGAALAMPW